MSSVSSLVQTSIRPKTTYEYLTCKMRASFNYEDLQDTCSFFLLTTLVEDVHWEV